MAFADGSALRFAYLAEPSFGELATPPAFKLLRITSSGLKTVKSTVESDEIRADGNITDLMLGGYDVSGDVGGELSYGAWDDIFAAAFKNDWTGDALTNAMRTKSLLFEEMLEAGENDLFSRFNGCMINKLSFSIQPKKPITMTASVMGRSEVTGTAELADATYAPAPTKSVMAAPRGVASLAVAGSTFRVRSMTLDINNNLRTRESIDDLYSAEFGKGSVQVTGSIEAYFESNEVYQRALDHESAAITAVLGRVAGEKYKIEIPKAVLGDVSKGERRKNTDVMMTLPFQGVLDPASGCSVRMTRAVL